MTLHWWMHWFWVTLWFAVITGIPLPPEVVKTAVSSAPIHKDDYIRPESALGSFEQSSGIRNDDDSPVSSSPVPSPQPRAPTPARENYRVSKSVGIIPSAPVSLPDGLESDKETEAEYGSDVKLSLSNLTESRNNNDYRVDREANNDGGDSRTTAAVLRRPEESVGGVLAPSGISRDLTASDNRTDADQGHDSNRALSPVRKKDSKVTWLVTGNKTGSPANGRPALPRNSSRHDDDDDGLAVLPLQEPTPARFKLVLNRTKFIPSTNVNNDGDDGADDKLADKSHDVEVDGGTGPLATAASILQGITESPRLSRARSAFPGDYQQDEQQEQRQQAKNTERIAFANSTNSSAMDIAAVTGSCLATVVLIGTMGSLGFVMYRRRYMNPPQTLNSDKCSNPDSSGYIDDSTIRDNSEEMYSLDNDSFLNSLEAMTIQNYWTDSVKHTKL